MSFPLLHDPPRIPLYIPFSCLLRLLSAVLVSQTCLFLMTLALLRSHGQVFCSMSHYYNFSDAFFFFSDYTVCIDLGKEDTEVMCCFHHYNLGSPFCLTEHSPPEIPLVFSLVYFRIDQSQNSHECSFMLVTIFLDDFSSFYDFFSFSSQYLREFLFCYAPIAKLESCFHLTQTSSNLPFHLLRERS